MPEEDAVDMTQLTRSSKLESQHTYYDICPWSHDERYLVYSSVPVDGEWTPFGHDTLACRDGRVNVLDLSSGETREVAGGAVYLKHGVTFCMWHPKKHKVYFRQNDEAFAVFDLDTGKKDLLPGRIRQLSPDGTAFAILMQSPHGGGQGKAIGIMTEDGTESSELVRREVLYDLTPNRDAFRPEDMLLGNTKWHPGSQHLLITMWTHGRPGVRRSLYVASRDGSEVRWLTYFGHHHSWTPGGQSILFNDRTVDERSRSEPRMFLIDFDGSNRRVVFDEPIGSHPLMHPAGRSIVDADKEGIYLARLDQGKIDRLVSFGTTFDGTHHGTHPHPVWNRGGSQVLYNSAESGHSEVYRITMRE